MNQDPTYSEDLDEDEEPQPAYLAPLHPKFERVTTDALRQALRLSAATSHSTDELWHTFKDFVLRHEYATFMDSLTDAMRAEIKNAIQEEQREKLMDQAVRSLRDSLGVEVRDRVRREIEDELRPRVTAEIRSRLATELEPGLRDALIARLQAQLRGEVERSLRAQLLEDNAFIEATKQELQRKILGL